MSVPTQPNGSSSHMMKTTKRGRPFLKDTLDLFATLIVSLELTTHKQFFRTFPNSFTTDEAALNLASLKFSQSNRGPDPRDPSRIVTTTTTTTFSMTREMAKAMAQHFMDARLIENAADRSSNLFKERGVYVLTPKGLHVLERFITKNGMNAEHLLHVFASQPICMKLLHLERRSSDDEIIISQSVITALFRRFAGRQPNYSPTDLQQQTQDPGTEYHERSKGIPVMDVQERTNNAGPKIQFTVHKHCFTAVSALEWLCDFTSIVGRDEAAEMAAHFVRFGLIALVSDKRKGTDSAVIFTVRGTTGNSAAAAETGDFRCTAKAIYRITDEGRRVARWDQSSSTRLAGDDSPNASNTNISSQRPSTDNSDEGMAGTEVSFGSGQLNGPSNLMQVTDAKIHRRISLADKLNLANQANSKALKESYTDRLKHILDEPALRSLFREFLRTNFCEENLSFWIEVEDFKRKFHITSSAIAVGSSHLPRPGPTHSRATPGQVAMEKHHESLIQMAFLIYNKYLAPSSPCELNIDHGLRNELVAYLSEVITDMTGKTFQGRVEPEHASAVNATQLQTMIRLYERIQNHVFRLMATDSVPKFIKTPKFMALRNWVEETEAVENDGSYPSMPPGLEEDEVGRTYVTISQAANERAHIGGGKGNSNGGGLYKVDS